MLYFNEVLWSRLLSTVAVIIITVISITFDVVIITVVTR